MISESVWNHKPIILRYIWHFHSTEFCYKLTSQNIYSGTYILRHIFRDIYLGTLWPSGIGSCLGRNRLWVRFLAVSDIYPMFIEPTITWVLSGFSGYIWVDTKIVFKKNTFLGKYISEYDSKHIYISEHISWDKHLKTYISAEVQNTYYLEIYI